VLVLSAAFSAGLLPACAARGPAPASAKTGGFIQLSRPGSINPIESDYAPGKLMELCDAAIARNVATLDAIAQLPVADRNFESTMLAFENANADLSDGTSPLAFMKDVSPSEALRNDGAACDKKLSEYFVTILTRKDLYDVLKTAKPIAGLRGAEKKAQSRLIEKTLLAFEQNGLKLPAEGAKKLKDLKTEIAKLQSEFSDNLNADNSTVEFEAAALDGVPADWLGALKKSADGKRVIVTTKRPDYDQVMRNAKSLDTRQKMLFAYWNRAAEKNTPLLQQAVAKRIEAASVAGKKTWLDYQTADRMAKDAKTVQAFLKNLTDKLKKKNQEDLAKLLKLKQESEPAAKQLDAADIEYYSYQLKKRDYTLDDEQIRQYFPASVVVKGVFEIYSRLLGVKFTEVKDAKVWNPDVKFYQVENASDGKTIGAFYTDFIPRPGKYGHAAAFTLISARRLLDGSYKHPTSAIVANFTPPSSGKPSLMTHSEVETFFHEFGHIMHQTLTQAPYASLAGSNVAQDFVEAPSQMLEEWVYDPGILNMVSGHYQDESKTLPRELEEKIAQAREFNEGYLYTRQLLFATYDMVLHTTAKPVNIDQTFDGLYRKLIGVEPPKGGHFPASFGHLMGGYDAGYYGYLWSEVYASDMFTQFEGKNLLSPAVGARYRHEVLEKGNMVEGLSMLRKFLKRDPNTAAFFKRLKI
jgi:thimet oligopeptidase